MMPSQEKEHITEQIIDTLDENIWQNLLDILNYKIFESTDHKISISLLSIIVIVCAFITTRIILKFVTKIVTNRLQPENRIKFKSIFAFSKYIIYALVSIIVFQSLGINFTPLLIASSALLVGVGLALQTFFQDILSGIFILIDQTVKVGDVIELDGKVGRVVNIKLRTTRAVTIDNKVMIIPNHQYLTNSLYNWTQNGNLTRDSITVGVAYGSDTQLVKKILLEAVNQHPSVLKHPQPMVLFENFGDSSLDFKIVYTINDSFKGIIPQSDIRFKIDELFRTHNIEIPFPQRVVTLKKEG